MPDDARLDRPDLFFERAEVATAIASAMSRRVGRGAEWSVVRLSARIGYSKSSIQSWLSATEPPSVPALFKLATVFGAEFLTEVFELVDMAALPLNGSACPLAVHSVAANYNAATAQALANDGRIDHREYQVLVRRVRPLVITGAAFLRAARAA